MADNDSNAGNRNPSQSQGQEGASVGQNQSQNLSQSQGTRERRGSQEDNSSQDEKREIVRQLFGDVGELKRDFSCAVESSILLHGRMYVTKKFLCFYSNLFGLEKKIRVPYSHISVISKENTALVIPNAISITTFRKEYVFRSFWDRDECYNLIKGLVEQVKGTKGSTASSHEEANAASIIHSKTDTNTNANANTNATTSSNVPSTTSSSPNRPASTRVGNGTAEEYETEDSKRASTRATEAAAAAVLENPVDAFKQELEKSKLKNETSPVVMGGTIEEFFDKFIADDAPLSYKKYQSETGDKDVEATSWVNSASSLGCTRDMRFLKPVAVPAMPYARALMIQRYQRFGDYGFTIASSTRMEDVPYCDFFTVENLLTVEATAENELTIVNYYEVKFIQSTMFKRFIEGNTNPDVKKWNEDFTKYIQENLPGLKKPDFRSRKRSNTAKSLPDAAPPAPGPFVTALNSMLEKVGLGPLPPATVTGPWAFYIAWFSLTLIFLFFAWQWRGVRNDLYRFDSTLRENAVAMQDMGRRVDIRDQLGDIAHALRDIRTHSEAVVRVELNALKQRESSLATSENNMFDYVQYLDGSGSLDMDRGMEWLTILRERHPLLAEHIMTLGEVNSVIHQLDKVLTNEKNDTSSDEDDTDHKSG